MHGTLIRLLLAAVAALLVLPGVASAKIIEVGQIGTPAPSCPTSPCEVISRTTAFQTRADGKRKVFAAPEAGRIVAWSITLGTPKRKQRKYFEENLGGTAQAGIVVLRQGDRRYGRVTAASPVEELRPFFGQTVQFPLAESLAVAEGDVGAGVGPRPRARQRLARQPSEGRMRRHADAERPSGRARPHAVQVRLPHRPGDLQRDADHDARAAGTRAEAEVAALGAEQVEQGGPLSAGCREGAFSNTSGMSPRRRDTSPGGSYGTPARQQRPKAADLQAGARKRLAGRDAPASGSSSESGQRRRCSLANACAQRQARRRPHSSQYEATRSASDAMASRRNVPGNGIEE
jgi:hypothetical protein